MAAAAITAVILALTSLTASMAQEVPDLRHPSGIVLDADTGAVLFASNEHESRYPASLTMVMTAYVVFEEIEAGRRQMDETMVLSPWAANAVPVRLGLKSGSTISIRDAVSGLALISAKDAARALADLVAGSERVFVDRMNQTAASLGMTRTRYESSTGQFAVAQTTTAYDQALLATAMTTRFRAWALEFFGASSFTYNKRTYQQRLPRIGADMEFGASTYSNPSGYSALLVARPFGRHLIVVLTGYPAQGQRNAMLRALLKTFGPLSIEDLIAGEPAGAIRQ